MKKQSWVTIEEASLYFKERPGVSFRWNRLTENDQQQLLNKSWKLIFDSGLYKFPESLGQDIKEAILEQALWLLTRPTIEKESFLIVSDALHPEAKKRLEKYKKPELEKMKIKYTNWNDDKERNQLLEGKFVFGEYELMLSLVYVNWVQSIQNHFYRSEIANKAKKYLIEAQRIWKNKGEKYPSMKAMHEIWYFKKRTFASEDDKLIQGNIDKIIEKLNKYQAPSPFYVLGKDLLKIKPEIFYIKPQNLLILTWAKAFQNNNNTIYWKIIAKTINSIYLKIKRTNLGDVFDDVSKEEVFKNQEIIRQVYYKYKEQPAKMELAESIYKKSFKDKISPFYKLHKNN